MQRFSREHAALRLKSKCSAPCSATERTSSRGLWVTVGLSTTKRINAVNGNGIKEKKRNRGEGGGGRREREGRTEMEARKQFSQRAKTIINMELMHTWAKIICSGAFMSLVHIYRHCRCNATATLTEHTRQLFSAVHIRASPTDAKNPLAHSPFAHPLIHILQKSKLFKLTLIINRVTFSALVVPHLPLSRMHRTSSIQRTPATIFLVLNTISRFILVTFSSSPTLSASERVIFPWPHLSTISTGNVHFRPGLPAQVGARCIWPCDQSSTQWVCVLCSCLMFAIEWLDGRAREEDVDKVVPIDIEWCSYMFYVGCNNFLLPTNLAPWSQRFLLWFKQLAASAKERRGENSGMLGYSMLSPEDQVYFNSTLFSKGAALLCLLHPLPCPFYLFSLFICRSMFV